ncbi:helix-turn-helix domain-containing protein [Aridibaculum aurantiacum]|uniref:helix-turn-helix domain-containing protein n=1 Tax=Aridibaculum aurantiacum TaxID=2810307 RepID=UPI001A967433|nr:helix-turn-helix domain-containing protein [Aridibaculum aurantiacum]
MSIGQIILIIVSGLGIFHGLFTAVLLWSTKAPNPLSNKLLSAVMVVLSLRVGKSVIMAFVDRFPMLYVYLGLCLMLFIGPLFLIYAKTVLQKNFALSKKELLHFVPAVVFIALGFPMQQFGFRNLPEYIAIFCFLFFYIHFLSYILFSWLKVIKAAESTTETKAWVNILTIGLSTIWFEYVLNLFEERVPYILGPIVYSVTVYVITFLAYKHKYLSAINTVKYKTTGLSESETENLFATADELVQKEALYLDSNLTLAILSKRLKSSSQKLSMAINIRSGSNFNEYVNRYRIAHAEGLLKDPALANMSIAAIAYECGFNSLSSFNTAFKKINGRTPSMFRNAMA